MTDLEKRINKVLGTLSPNNKTGTFISGIKKTLNSSSQIVNAVNNIGDSLQENIKEEIGGITGAVGGWLAGKTTKFVGGVGGGIVAGSLKTVAGLIPDSSDIKLPESDKKVAHCIDTYSIPLDKVELFKLLQYIWTIVNSKNSPYGKQTMEAFKNILSRVQSAFTTASKNDEDLLLMAKPYLPQKRFGLF